MYAWTLSTKARLRQCTDEEELSLLSNDGTNGEERDSMANRALLRVQAKLKGQADDSLGYTSVEGHVSRLIQAAISPALLSRLFRGWQAYL
jgi:FATC domain